MHTFRSIVEAEIRCDISVGLDYLLLLSMHAVTIVDSALRALEVLGLSESCPTSLKANVSSSSLVLKSLQMQLLYQDFKIWTSYSCDQSLHNRFFLMCRAETKQVSPFVSY